jgi:hypothetical protein
MTAAMPGQYNAYVPSHEATGKMVVDYARNEKRFTVNKWTKTVKVDKTHGLYRLEDFSQRSYIADTNGKNALWPDGQVAPTFRDNVMAGEWKNYFCQRYALGWTLGDMSIDQASWDLVAQHSSMVAQQHMILRTVQAAAIAQNSSNYAAANVLDVGAGGAGNTGRWDVSTTARTDIKRSIDAGVTALLDATYAAIELDDLYLVMNDETARKISVTQEIVDYIKGSPDAMAYIKGEMVKNNPNFNFNLPPKLYGVNLVIDDTRYTSAARRATRSATRALNSDKPFLIARPGGLEGLAGAPNFSFLTNFVYEEMNVETMKDKNNRLTSGRVVDTRAFEVTAQQAGVLFNDVLT